MPNFQNTSRRFERKTLEKICADHKTTPAAILIALCPPNALAALKAKALRYHHPNGMVVCFRNGIVVTVLTAAQLKLGKPKKARRRAAVWSRR